MKSFIDYIISVIWNFFSPSSSSLPQSSEVSVSTNLPSINNSMYSPHLKIVKWAQAIAHFEGANPVLNNAGNFKYSTLLGTWGGMRSNQNGSDGGVFCKFATHELGFQALCNFLTLGAEDELKNYHNARTIKEFTLVYTNHPIPKYDYSDSLIKELGVTPDTDVSTFLL